MAYIYFAAGIGLVGVIIYYYLTKNYGYWEKRQIPCLKNSLPGLGNVYPMFFMTKSITQMYREFYEKTPGCSVVGFYNLREPALLIKDPDLIKSVLQTDFSNFSVNGLIADPDVDLLLAGNPFFSEGEPWKVSRQQLSSAFTSGKLKYIHELINAVGEKFVTYLYDITAKGNGEVEVELKELFSRFTAEVVASAALGAEANSFKHDDDGTFTTIGQSIFKPSTAKALKQFATMFAPFLAKVLDVHFIPPQTEGTFIKLVKDMLKYREDSGIQRNDFLQLMINLKKSGAPGRGNDGEFNDETIATHAMSFFFDGYETSSIALSFIGYQLARHPEIQGKLRAEILTGVQKRNGITFEALQEMTYMEQVINESMRIEPTIGTFFKVCSKEIVLKGSDGISCRVMPGTPIMISLAGLHMDPEHWPEPEKFDPERFSEENKLNRHKFTFLPFGEGPRACVGRRIGMLQMKAAIATMLQKFTLELSPKTKVPIDLELRHHFLSSARDGIWVKLKAL